MWPFVKPGTKVIVDKVPLTHLKLGDIVLYQAAGRLVCHRLVKKIRDGDEFSFYVRGDSSTTPAEAMTEEMYEGKVIGILKNGEMIDLTKRSRRMMASAILLIAPFYSRFFIKRTRP